MALQEPAEDASSYDDNNDISVPSTWPALDFADAHNGRLPTDRVDATLETATHSRPEAGSSANYVTRALSDALRTSEGERLALEEQVADLQKQLQHQLRRGEDSQGSSSPAATTGPSTESLQNGRPSATGLYIPTQVRVLQVLAGLSAQLHSSEAASAARDELLHVAGSLGVPQVDAGQDEHLDARILELLKQLRACEAPPLPASPGHPPPRHGRSTPHTVSPQSTRRDHGQHLPPTPASVRHADVASSAGGRSVLHEHLYSPDTASPRFARGGASLRLWDDSKTDGAGASAGFGEGTPLPGADGAPVPAFAYGKGKGKTPYPSRPSHPLHRHSNQTQSSARAVALASDAKDAGGDESPEDADGALLQALAGEGGGGIAAAPEQEELSTSAVPSPFVAHTTTRHFSPQKRSKFVAFTAKSASVGSR